MTRDHLPRHLGHHVRRQRRCRGRRHPASPPIARSPPSPGTSPRPCCGCPPGCGTRASSGAAGPARTLRAAVATILARRRAAGLEGDDLLARLARAQDPETGEPMSEKQLVDNLVTFLAAGHETTAKALTWTLYLIARAPQWQERILAEIDAVVGAGEPIGAEHLERLARHARGAEGGHAPLSAGARHDAPGRRGHRAGPETDQGRHAHRHSHLRGAPAPEAVGGPGSLRPRALRARARGAATRARSSCRSASARAPASAARSP